MGDHVGVLGVGTIPGETGHTLELPVLVALAKRSDFDLDVVAADCSFGKVATAQAAGRQPRQADLCEGDRGNHRSLRRLLHRLCHRLWYWFLYRFFFHGSFLNRFRRSLLHKGLFFDKSFWFGVSARGSYGNRYVAEGAPEKAAKHRHSISAMQLLFS